MAPFAAERTGENLIKSRKGFYLRPIPEHSGFILRNLSKVQNVGPRDPPLTFLSAHDKPGRKSQLGFAGFSRSSVFPSTALKLILINECDILYQRRVQRSLTSTLAFCIMQSNSWSGGHEMPGITTNGGMAMFDVQGSLEFKDTYRP